MQGFLFVKSRKNYYCSFSLTASTTFSVVLRDIQPLLSSTCEEGPWNSTCSSVLVLFMLSFLLQFILVCCPCSTWYLQKWCQCGFSPLQLLGCTCLCPCSRCIILKEARSPAKNALLSAPLSIICRMPWLWALGIPLFYLWLIFSQTQKAMGGMLANSLNHWQLLWVALQTIVFHPLCHSRFSI